MSDIDEFYNTTKTMLMLWSYNKSLDNIEFPDSLEQISSHAITDYIRFNF